MCAPSGVRDLRAQSTLPAAGGRPASQRGQNRIALAKPLSSSISQTLIASHLQASEVATNEN